MSQHRHDTDIQELKTYFTSVIDWISGVFSDVESEMRGIEWGRLFETYHNQPYDSPYIAIPKVSSQNRRYIPMDYLEGEIIPGDKLFTMPSATSYEFGILMSNVHMAWTRAVCGRLKSDYSYSNMIVYNNFPWPSPTNDQKEKIRKTAQAILNARALYTDSNLADPYDPLTMPTELLKAHKANNRAVMHAYGFSIKMSEADCVAELMRMYQKLTKEK